MKKESANYWGSILLSFFLFGCTIAPKPIKDDIASFDSSTPPQYSNQNSGFLGFTDDGFGIITVNAKNKYNNLIELYKDVFFKEMGVKLVNNFGIKHHVDKYNNKLYAISPQALEYFIILNQWIKSGKETN
jgi:hypothetical protein